MAIGAKPNRLIREKSPYLLQHAHNPVDWYPWGEEAFAKARVEEKPILLSIGYSTCHWCHVMERESFEDPDIADLMNRSFVSIKLDCEERPDVDRIYMTAVQAMTGQGGWPLNVFLTPDLKPFYGGTYFPPKAQWGRPGFPEILNRIAGLWKDERDKLTASAEALREALERYSGVEGARGEPGAEVVEAAISSYGRMFDPEHSGFGGAPKFPMPVHQHFLLRAWAATGRREALEMPLKTLRAMAAGGIRDQLGGGFHRYSTDERWHIPHFEKMLYDNAQLAVNYLEAYQIARETLFADVARDTLEYVLRDMTAPEGGFYSAEDADSLPPDAAPGSRKVEGAFYVWTQEEILRLCGPTDGKAFCRHYGVKPEGNAESDPHGELAGKNHLYAAEALAEADAAPLERARKTLFAARSKRPRPHLDDKVLVSWNGLMITAFAKGAQVLAEARHADAAEKAARFLESELYDKKEKKLFRRWKDGERKVSGFSDDYAFLAQGLLDLYETTLDSHWLELSIELAERMNELFLDARAGGCFMTAPDHDANLLVRVKESSDNVEPCASSVAALLMLRLSSLTGRRDFREAAEKTLGLFAGQLAQRPTSLPCMLSALCFRLSEPRQVVLAGEPGSSGMRELLRRVHSMFLPNKALALARDTPFQKSAQPLAGKAAAYVCVDYACKLPTSDPEALAQSLLEAARH